MHDRHLLKLLLWSEAHNSTRTAAILPMLCALSHKGTDLDGDQAQRQSVLWRAASVLGGSQAFQDARCAHEKLQAAHA